MRQLGGGKRIDALPGCGCGGWSLGEETGEEGFGGLHFGCRDSVIRKIEFWFSGCRERCCLEPDSKNYIVKFAFARGWKSQVRE